MKIIVNIFLTFCFAILASRAWGVDLDADEEEEYSNSLRSLLRRQMEEAELESLKRSYLGLEGEKRGAFDCKELNQKCSVVGKCCGTLQCYWENGFSLRKSGVCVECVRQGQLCQRDGQCCKGLVCQKGKLGYTDGICDAKRPSGGACHENDQCQSNNCKITPWQVLSRVEGSCA